MEALNGHFSNLTPKQIDQFGRLEALYTHWNERINVISRKDMGHFYERHLLHSLGIAKIQPFLPQTRILDVGTGGGFPGIPLAILHPECDFYLVDSIGKKIKVVADVANQLGLSNVTTHHGRAEKVVGHFDFIVSRAVTRMEQFVPWVRGKVRRQSKHPLKNGILYLKGGDLTEELSKFPKARCYPLSTYFKEDFFKTKKVVHLPM